jgi:hypothetical protein
VVTAVDSGLGVAVATEADVGVGMSVGTEVGAGVDVAAGTAEHATPMTAIRATKPRRMRDFIIIYLLEVEFAHILRFEAAGLQLNHHEATQANVIKEKVNVVILPANHDVVIAAHKSKPHPKL